MKFKLFFQGSQWIQFSEFKCIFTTFLLTQDGKQGQKIRIEMSPTRFEEIRLVRASILVSWHRKEEWIKILFGKVNFEPTYKYNNWNQQIYFLCFGLWSLKTAFARSISSLKLHQILLYRMKDLIDLNGWSFLLFNSWARVLMKSKHFVDTKIYRNWFCWFLNDVVIYSKPESGFCQYTI